MINSFSFFRVVIIDNRFVRYFPMFLAFFPCRVSASTNMILIIVFSYSHLKYDYLYVQ